MKFPRFYLKLFEDIYINLYEVSYDEKIHCFLCGSNNKDFRDFLRVKLTSKDIKTIYAENLFQALVYNESKENHLDLEDLLASNVELILIILESPGALVELGMFSNHIDHCKKLIVLMDMKYKNEESFINYGPIKKIKELDDIKRIFYYKTEENGQKLQKQINTYQKRELGKALNLYQKKNLGLGKKHILDIISIYYFLRVALFIISPIDETELNNLLKHLCKKQKMKIYDKEIKLNVSSVLYWLQEEQHIEKIDDVTYGLTKQGIADSQKELYKIFGTKLIDGYRVQALNYTLRIKDKIS